MSKAEKKVVIYRRFIEPLFDLPPESLVEAMHVIMSFVCDEEYEPKTNKRILQALKNELEKQQKHANYVSTQRARCRRLGWRNGTNGKNQLVRRRRVINTELGMNIEERKYAPVPPSSLKQVLEYAEQNNLPLDLAEEFFYYYEDREWWYGSKKHLKPVLLWRNKLRQWIAKSKVYLNKNEPERVKDIKYDEF